MPGVVSEMKRWPEEASTRLHAKAGSGKSRDTSCNESPDRSRVQAFPGMNPYLKWIVDGTSHARWQRLAGTRPVTPVFPAAAMPANRLPDDSTDHEHAITHRASNRCRHEDHTPPPPPPITRDASNIQTVPRFLSFPSPVPRFRAGVRSGLAMHPQVAIESVIARTLPDPALGTFVQNE